MSSSSERKVEAEAAAMLRRVAEAVEEGELDAPPGPARKLLARIEGAATALEVAGEETERTDRA